MVVSLLRFAITLYWKVMPAARRRRCLFHESCSRVVYRVLGEAGLQAGLRVLRARARACRPGFQVVLGEGGEPLLMLRDGSHLTTEAASSEMRGLLFLMGDGCRQLLASAPVASEGLGAQKIAP